MRKEGLLEADYHGILGYNPIKIHEGIIEIHPTFQKNVYEFRINTDNIDTNYL
jgi:hypothetical protein